MTSFILGIVFLCLALIGVIVRKTYFELPITELKKRKSQGDDYAKELYKLVSYGSSVRGLLWLYQALTLALSLTLLIGSLPIVLSVIVSALILYYAFSMLPNTKVSTFDKRLARLVLPVLTWKLKYITKYIDRVQTPLSKRYTLERNTIFDEEDLLRFFKNQSKRPANRIEPEVLLRLERELVFNTRIIKDFMMPSKKVKTLLEDDVIGPILINELHESGQEYALVKASPKSPEISGVLALKALGIKSQGKVSDLMDETVFYLNEHDLLASVIKAFFDTKKTLFVVINESQRFVGVISVEEVIKQLVGDLSSITFDSYTNPEAVANLFKQDIKTDDGDDRI